jgi:hypothetical protein
VRHLPEKHNGEQDPGFKAQRFSCCGPANDRGERAGNRSYDATQRSLLLERGVGKQVAQDNGSSDQSAQGINYEDQTHQPTDSDERAEHKCIERLDPAIWQWTQSGAMHLGVRLTFKKLIQGEGSSSRQRRTDKGIEQTQVVWFALTAEVEPDQGRDQNHENDTRFCQRKEVRSAVPNAVWGEVYFQFPLYRDMVGSDVHCLSFDSLLYRDEV